MVRGRKSASYQLLGTKGSLSGPQEFRASLSESDCVGCNRQHNCGRLHQQTGRYEIRLSLCPPLETPILVPPQGNSSESQAHSRSVKCDSRQALPAQSGNSDREVTRSDCVQSVVLEMGPTKSGSVCHPVQLQTPQVCLTGSGSDCLGCGRSESTLAGSGCVCLPSRRPPQLGDLQDSGARVSTDDSHCPRVAQHGVVLGPGQSVSADSIQSPSAEGSGDSTIQRDPSPRSVKSESACMAPRTSFVQGKGFSGQVAA